MKAYNKGKYNISKHEICGSEEKTYEIELQTGFREILFRVIHKL